MNIISLPRQTYTFLRWKLKLPRYLGKFFRSALRGARRTVAPGLPTDCVNRLYATFQETGYAAVPGARFKLPDVDLKALAGKCKDDTFYNVLDPHWEALKPLVCEVLADREITDCIVRYFDGQPWLWNVALNYSEPLDRVQDSQLWHFDYGDTKQMHLMLYFSDVDRSSGPFTFFPAAVSARVRRSKFVIERFTDADLADQFGIDAAQTIRLIGDRESAFIADPGRVLHQGARCMTPRLVLFLSFTTQTPMSLGGSKTLPAPMRRDLYQHYKQNRQAPIFREEFFL